MTWTRSGIVFDCDRAQMPVFSYAAGRHLVCYSDRDDDGRSFGNIVECKFNAKQKNEIYFMEPKQHVIRPGLPGQNDNAGVMPMQIINNKIFYIGWSLRKDVPYYNMTHIANWNGRNAEKLGPVLPPDIIDNSFSGTFHVMLTNEEAFWIGYYLSCDRWVCDELNNPQPSYDIKIATSSDCINWTKLGKTAISREGNEEGLSGATVLKFNGVHHMWFSAREGKNFRFGTGAYSIKHATSTDGVNWTRSDKYGLTADLAYGENMCAYPSIVEVNGVIHMIYNGKSFGEHGIFHAWMSNKDLI